MFRNKAMFKNLNFVKRDRSQKGSSSGDNRADLFSFKYSCFKMLLESNAELINVITDIEEKLLGQQVFGMSYVRSRSAKAVFHALRMIKNMDDLSGHHYSPLFDSLENINQKIKEILGRKKEISISEFILPYAAINAEMTDWVGGKNANLGEIHSRIGLPVPRGFAITTRAFESFLLNSTLFDEISNKKTWLDPDNPENIHTISDDIRELILSADVPAAIEDAILMAYAELARETSSGKIPDPFRISMRSSAVGEDGELSFAGQYLTLLNVPQEHIIRAYKEIIASLYSPHAITYRLNKGIRDEDIAMSVACLQMVDSVAGGVVYSRNPLNMLEEKIIVTAVWGLGPYAVDGVITPDTYTVGENCQIISSDISRKTVQLVNKPDGGVTEIPVADALQEKPCLSSENTAVLADYARRLEAHYGCPQDIEWAMDNSGSIFILQSRTLRSGDSGKSNLVVPVLTGYPLLIENGVSVSAGVGFGPAVHVSSFEDLLDFPDGGILVARHSSPKFVIVMKKAKAIIIDTGNITGHMSALAREFGVPTIVNTHVATSIIHEGMEITVDAYSGRVYQGKVPELEAYQVTGEFPMKETPVYSVLKEISDWIIPLYLVDPGSPKFAPSFCRTLHDISRLVHEFSYSEMFKLGDSVSDKKGLAFKLEGFVPPDLYVIDLGSGLMETKENLKSASCDKIASVPFKALLNGLMHNGFQQHKVRTVKGFLSVMREKMIYSSSAAEKFGDRSYAIISDKYLNFSSRVGYHHSIIDSYCCSTVNMNYISFSFKGGAEGDVQKNRRARAIARILQSLDFTADVMGDRVNARYQKHEQHLIEDKLDLIGRLLQFARQMDVLMTDDAGVEVSVENFLVGNYNP